MKSGTWGCHTIGKSRNGKGGKEEVKTKEREEVK